MTYPHAFTLCLAAVFTLALAACGGGSKEDAKHLASYWTATPAEVYVPNEYGWESRVECRTLIERVGKDIPGAIFVPYTKTDPTHLTEKPFKVENGAGSTMCFYPGYLTPHWHRGGDNIIQTKEDELSLTVTAASMGTRYTKATIDEGALDEHILATAALHGREMGFKYGVFDNIDEKTRAHESEVTGTTSVGQEQGAAIVTPYYQSTLGVQFGNSRNTTIVNRTGDSLEITRKHTLRFYHSEPDTDQFFDIDIVLKSLKATDAKMIDFDEMEALGNPFNFHAFKS